MVISIHSVHGRSGYPESIEALRWAAMEHTEALIGGGSGGEGHERLGDHAHEHCLICLKLKIFICFHSVFFLVCLRMFLNIFTFLWRYISILSLFAFFKNKFLFSFSPKYFFTHLVLSVFFNIWSFFQNSLPFSVLVFETCFSTCF